MCELHGDSCDWESYYFWASIIDDDEVPDTWEKGSLMNAAGRCHSQPFADLRSASLAHRRTKKYPRKKSSSRGRWYCCPICRPAPHLPRLARRKEIRHEIRAEPWHDDDGADVRHSELLEFTDDIRRYNLFGYKKEQFENTEAGEDGWVQSGEDFGMWGRRRIEEMRAVKEDRMRQHNNKDTTPPPAPAATTLPSSPSDIEAHYLLNNTLKHFTQALKFPRRGLYAAPPYINGFHWFGEYEWQWHRNQSGCWELGYARDCEDKSINNNWTWFRCFCKDFALGDLAPEEAQRCSLVEWVRGSLWDVMVKEEYKRLLCQVKEVKDTESVALEWEVVSNGDVVSDGWSVVDGEVV